MTQTPTPVPDEISAELEDLAAQVGQVGDQLDDALARADAAEHRADDLAVQLAECKAGPGPDPGPGTPTVFGASDGVWPIPGVAKLPGLRAYLGAGGGSRDLDDETSWSGTKELADAVARTTEGGLIWLSFKQDNPEALDRLLVMAPKNRRHLLTYHHEPQTDAETPAQYQRAWARVLEVVEGHPGVETATCLLGHMTDADDEPWYVDGATYHGYDRYNPGLGKAKRYADPARTFARCLAFARRKGKRCVFGETGTIIVPGSTAAERAGWAARERAHLAAQTDVPVVLWWNQSHMAIDADLARVWFA